MSLERFCRKEIATAEVGESVAAAARKLRDRHVGALVVVDEIGRPLGALTDRDIACRVVAEGLDGKTPVEAVMSRGLVTVPRDGTIDEVAFAMRRHGVRRVPIVDAEGRLCGLVAFDDLIVLLSSELHESVSALRENRGP